MHSGNKKELMRIFTLSEAVEAVGHAIDEA
jgi:hypothetical protein